jgi:threonine dehydratase
MPPAPQYACPLLARRLGAEVWVKHENHTPTGAFKARGGLVYMAGLKAADPDCPGIVSATRGNHDQSLAFVARRHGLRATIVVPRGNGGEKDAAMRARGAELVEHGDDFQDASEHALRLAGERGLHRVPSFHPDLIRGVATAWMELLRAAPELDVVFVPIGLDSGLCGAIAARAALGARMRLVGVVSAHAGGYALSIAARRAVEARVSTRLTDGMAVRVPDERALAIMYDAVDEIVEADDDDVARAMKAMYVDTRTVAEGAGAASLAAAMRLARERPAAITGLRVGLTLCGANVDHGMFVGVLRDTVLD